MFNKVLTENRSSWNIQILQDENEVYEPVIFFGDIAILSIHNLRNHYEQSILHLKQMAEQCGDLEGLADIMRRRGYPNWVETELLQPVQHLDTSTVPPAEERGFEENINEPQR